MRRYVAWALELGGVAAGCYGVWLMYPPGFFVLLMVVGVLGAQIIEKRMEP